MMKKEIIPLDVGKCLSNNLDFNEYAVLYCIGLKKDLPQLNNLNKILENLESKALIQINNNNSLELRGLSKKILKIPSSEDLNVEEWVDEYRNLFPNGVESGGYPVRGIKKTCITNLKKFILEYKSEKKTVLEDPKIYVEKKQRENFNYMMLAHFFIYKNNNSMLETFIENLESREQSYEDQFHKSI